jgi:hypothetical protein
MIAIYEPLYRPGQEPEEPAFLPRRVENSDAGWRELRIIVDMFRKGVHREQALTGLFSPRFRQKAKISGSQLIDHIEANPGASVYIVNAHGFLPYFAYNVWMDRESMHPGLIGRAQALLDASRVNLQLSETPRHAPDQVCYNNYWVGTERFWDDYVGGVLNPIAEFLEREPQSEAALSVFAPTFHYEPAPFLPFIIERLFSTYLSHAKPKVVAYPTDPLGSCRYDFERDIVSFVRNRVTRADREGYFPPDLIAWMRLLCRLRARYLYAYFADNPHHFSRKPVDRELIDIGLNGLNAIPIPPLP